jgi:hypothetical protein
MGFTEVYDYAAGKADWIAMGLPTEHRDTRKRIEEVARKDAPTCSVHDRIGQVGAELPDGWNACVVLRTDRIVLGLVESPADANANQSIEEIMRPGPLTFRPGRTVAPTACGDRVDTINITPLCDKVSPSPPIP